MSWTKKGQSGAAILLALIAVMIIMYVLFLPPADRAALLGESQTGVPGQNGQPVNVIFTSTVGRVYLTTVPSQTHSLPSFDIRAVQSGAVLASRDTVTARNNAFEKSPGIITFAVDPSLTQNAVLSMNLASKTGGNLIIYLNGQEVFNQAVSTRSIAPIPLSGLNTTNTITFSASSVGFAFWSTNSYTLSNVKVTADVTDLSGASASERFSISQDEFNAMDSATLSFVPVCNTPGKIELQVNGASLYSGTPDCGGLNTLEVAPSRLQPGENTMSFSTRDADIVLDQASITTTAKQQQNQAFTFNIDPQQVQGKVITLNVLFADNTDKRGTIVLNGKSIPLSAQSTFTTPIAQYIQPGVNTITFQATDKDFEVVKFDVLSS